MARTTVNDSASSQFFIMHKTTNYLDGQYAAFGKMTEGEDVLDKIASVKTDESDDSPLAPVIIDKVEVIDEPDLPIIKIQRPY
jgi:peptidyl-prolyl cis-trans isomerase B (cyclophilin B)